VHIAETARLQLIAFKSALSRNNMPVRDGIGDLK